MKKLIAIALSVMMIMAMFTLQAFAETKLDSTNYLHTEWAAEEALFNGTVTKTQEDGADVLTYVPQYGYPWFSPTLRIFDDLKALLGDNAEATVVLSFDVRGVFADPSGTFDTQLLVRGINPVTNATSYADYDNFNGKYDAKDKGGLVFSIPDGSNNMAFPDPKAITINGTSWTTYQSEPIRVTADELDKDLFADWVLCFDNFDYSVISGIQFRNTAIYKVLEDGEKQFKEGMARDQVTVNNVDKASFGGNAEVTEITENLYPLMGEQIRFWGWYANNKGLDKYGLVLDDGEMQYFDRYEAEDIVKHNQNVFKENDVYASRYEILTAITEGRHTAKIYALYGDEQSLIWTVNYFCLPEEAQPGTEPAEIPQTGDSAVTMFAVIAVLAMSGAVLFLKKKSF
ncbi:MAG: LPXTG cell wall anchor domain-containing protein [Clostridia bacterium]|nr:LPXTG cell wall anchor domain-containing protein [Clostridia bacterium]